MWPEVFHRLGLVPAAQRRVKPMPEALRRLVPPPTDNDITLKPGTPDVEKDTMPLIISKVKRTLYQTKKLAAKLKGGSLADTLRNDSNFILQFIKYKKDAAEHEQVRSPRRLVYDGAGDCDCYAVFLASVLTNQGIKFKFRITKYASSNGQWSHIYIIVPKDQRHENMDLYERGQYYVLDPVTNLHDHEVSYKQKRDYTMSLQYLDGIGSGMLSACETIEEKSVKEIGQLRQYIDNESIRQKGLVPTEEFLANNNIPYQLAVDKQTNGGFIIVSTPNGDLKVPTIITKQDAQTLYDAYHAPVMPGPPQQSEPPSQQAITPTDTTTTDKPEPIKAAGINWWGLLALAGTALSAMKSNGPGGLPTPSLGRVPTKKLKVVHF